MRKEFYETCAKIIDVEHEFNSPVRKRTRWNNRKLGNGRFPGFGLIRHFGSCIIVTPKDRDSTTFKHESDVFDYLEILVLERGKTERTLGKSHD